MTGLRGGGRLLANYGARHKALAISAAVALVVAAAGMLLLFSSAGWFTNQIFGSGDPASVDRAFLIFAVSLAAVAVASGARFALISTFGERVANDIRRDLFERILRYEYAFFETHRPGELATHVAANVTVLQQALGSTISVAARSAIMLVGGVVLLVIRSPLLFVAVLIVAPLAIMPLHFWGARVRTASQATQEAIGDATSRLTEALIGIETVKLFGQEAEETGRFERAIGRAEAASLRQIRYRTLLNILLAVLLFGAVAAIVWIGARQMTAGTISSAELASSVGLFVVVASSIAALGDMYGEYQKVSGAIDQIADVMNRPVMDRRGGPDACWDGGTLGISFESVRFRYPSRAEHLAIADFSLRVEPGERIALVGPSGAGKSTLFKLLQGLYEPEAGEIRIGGVWSSSSSCNSPAAFLSVVPQDVMIFADTALANIRFARVGASLEEVREAARTAHADEFISALPDGYDTQLGPRGVRLSGGQRQRIAIARAALRNSPVLLLDEATSSLDSESERVVLDALDGLMKNRTTLIIAHRFSTVADADRTVVMDAGGIVDEGQHDALLARCPLYERLVRLQLRH